MLQITITIHAAILSSTSPCPALEFGPNQSDPVLEAWRWQTFPQLQGQGFRVVAEDANGHVWFGTDRGVKHYEGLNWTNYTVEDGLHGAPINVLCANRDGHVYAGSRKGISLFENGSWRHAFPVDTNVD